MEKSIELVSKLESLLGEMSELSQGRSDYMLDHFVVGQHDLPGKQRQQVVSELIGMLFALADLNDEIELAEMDLERYACVEESDRRSQIERRKIERKIQALKIQLTGRMREAEHLLALLEKMPKYTAAQLEAEEPEYWKRRLARQAFMAMRGDPGNLDAMLQMVTVPGFEKPRLPLTYEQLLMSTGVELLAPGGEE